MRRCWKLRRWSWEDVDSWEDDHHYQVLLDHEETIHKEGEPWVRGNLWKCLEFKNWTPDNNPELGGDPPGHGGLHPGHLAVDLGGAHGQLRDHQDPPRPRRSPSLSPPPEVSSPPSESASPKVENPCFNNVSWPFFFLLFSSSCHSSKYLRSEKIRRQQLKIGPIWPTHSYIWCGMA